MFMELTDPDLVYLLFDSGHLTFAGIDPVPVLKNILIVLSMFILRMFDLMFIIIRLYLSI